MDLITISNDSFISEKVLPSDIDKKERVQLVRQLANKLWQLRDQSKLALGQLFHEISENNYYTDYGFENFESWAKENFESQSSYAVQIRDTFRKWMIECKGDAQVLSKIPFTKLISLKAHVTEDNYGELVKLSQEGSFEDVKAFVREQHPDKPKSRGDVKTYKFKLTEDQALLADQALDIAEELCESNIPGKAYEYIFGSFLMDEGVAQGRFSQLNQIIHLIENQFDVKIYVEPKEEQEITITSGVLDESPNENSSNIV